MTDPSGLDDWTAIVPVRPWSLSRTDLAPSDEQRVRLARAMTLDTLDVVARVSRFRRVVVVTAQAPLSNEVVADPRFTILDDRPLAAGPPRVNAVERGLWWAATHAPAARVVVLPADLAAAEPASMSQALVRLGRYRQAHVEARTSGGVTLVAASSPGALDAHAACRGSVALTGRGSVGLTEVAAGIRHDFDQWSDVISGSRLPLGYRTREVLASR